MEFRGGGGTLKIFVPPISRLTELRMIFHSCLWNVRPTYWKARDHCDVSCYFYYPRSNMTSQRLLFGSSCTKYVATRALFAVNTHSTLNHSNQDNYENDHSSLMHSVSNKIYFPGVKYAFVTHRKLQTHQIAYKFNIYFNK